MLTSEVSKICENISQKETRELWSRLMLKTMSRNISKAEAIKKLTVMFGRKKMAYILLDIRKEELKPLPVPEEDADDPSLLPAEEPESEAKEEKTGTVPIHKYFENHIL